MKYLLNHIHNKKSAVNIKYKMIRQHKLTEHENSTLSIKKTR